MVVTGDFVCKNWIGMTAPRNELEAVPSTVLLDDVVLWFMVSFWYCDGAVYCTVVIIILQSFCYCLVILLFSLFSAYCKWWTKYLTIAFWGCRRKLFDLVPTWNTEDTLTYDRLKVAIDVVRELSLCFVAFVLFGLIFLASDSHGPMVHRMVGPSLASTFLWASRNCPWSDKRGNQEQYAELIWPNALTCFDFLHG